MKKSDDQVNVEELSSAGTMTLTLNNFSGWPSAFATHARLLFDNKNLELNSTAPEFNFNKILFNKNFAIAILSI